MSAKREKCYKRAPGEKNLTRALFYGKVGFDCSCVEVGDEEDVDDDNGGYDKEL